MLMFWRLLMYVWRYGLSRYIVKILMHTQIHSFFLAYCLEWQGQGCLLAFSFISVLPNEGCKSPHPGWWEIMASTLIFLNFSMKRLSFKSPGPTRKENHVPPSLKASCKTLHITSTPCCTSRLICIYSCCHLSGECGLTFVSFLRRQLPSHQASTLFEYCWQGAIARIAAAWLCWGAKYATPSTNWPHSSLRGGCEGSCLDGGGVPGEQLPSPRLVSDASELPKQGEDKIPWQASWPCLWKGKSSLLHFI